MFEFKTTDFYDVAEVIRKAYDNPMFIDLTIDNIEHILYDYRVSTIIVETVEKRFRKVNDDDDREYYTRLDYLFKESLKRFLALIS